MAVKKYLDLEGLKAYHGQLKTNYYVDQIPTVVNKDTSGSTPVYTLKAATLNGVIPTANVTMSAGPSNDLNIATKKYVDDSVKDITSAMVFKGGVTATTASNTTTLTLGDATLGDINAGYTFKFTANESGGDTFKIGDILIANEKITHTVAATITYDSSKWTLVPSGDDVDVTSVGVSNAEDAIITLHTSNSEDAAITSTGTLSAAHSTSGVTAGTYGSNSAQTPAFGGTASIPYVTVNATGHITAAGTANVTIPNTAAGASTLGLVSVATDSGLSNTDGAISVNVDGTIVTNTSGTISVADASTTGKGVVKIGTNINVSSGTISVATADASTLGVVSIGDNIDVSNGEISVPTADASTTANGKFGVVKTGSNITNTSGVIDVEVATEGTTTDGTKGIVTTTSNSSGLTITSGSIAVRTATDSGIIIINDSTHSNYGLDINTITYSEAGNDISALFA